MSKHKKVINEYTLFPTCQTPFSSAPLHDKKDQQLRATPACNQNTTDLQHKTKPTRDAQSQFNSQIHKSLFQTNQKSCQNTRLIPLKLSTTTASHKKNSLSCEEYLNRPKTINQKQYLKSATSHRTFHSTEEELKSVLVEIKGLYFRSNHKQCAARCRLFLKITKDSFNVDPAYRVYLASYLASSLEIMAFTLPNNSSVKTSLYHEALTCYKSALSDLEHALFCVDSAISTSSALNSPSASSSARSSIDSVFSQYSKSSSLSSATQSEENSPNYMTKRSESPGRRPKKKVSFSLTQCQPLNQSTYHEDSEQSALSKSITDFFPAPPTIQTAILKKRMTLEPAPLNLSRAQSLDTSKDAISPYCNKISHLLRYKNLLSGFYSQFRDQIKNIQDIIDQVNYPAANVQDMYNPSSRLCAERNYRKTEGWPRKRFDGSRYQELCESVLSEL
ncbi:hypothetical protein GcM1_235042 [Golovinomyces cichoracearum]|uniref:Uncharacterized protein n=1 Tax=Golovinomyces cichoracearum TaxID=62708 RepID=A0A420IKV3_9PEZI|nr:hypothetical protein GcM1_235042 [Golovinomyces cichoracearum]